MESSLTTEDIFAPEGLLRFVPKTARRLLDCDCGDGARGTALRDWCGGAGVHVAGITRDPDQAAAARKSLDKVALLDAHETKLPFDAASFECVLCPDVLACLRDPAPLVEEMARVLAPGGLALITVPNIQFFETVLMLASGRWEYSTQGVMDRRHIRFFTAFTINRLLKEHGLAARACSSLVLHPPEAMPLDEKHCHRAGSIVIGPLDEKEYARYRTEHYLLFAEPEAAG